MAGLTVHGLSKSFGATCVLDRVSFEVEPGELCILLGPSGCGKTTLLRIVAGLERGDEGRVLVGDVDVTGLTPRDRDVAMVFQSYALYPHMTVFENMAFPLKARRTVREEIRQRVESAAGLLGIGDLLARKPRELSGGQRQRVAIGRAIVRSPRLFLFDEPLSNLDAKLRAGMRVELAKLHRTLGATMVYVTHDQVEAMTLGEKIVLLHEGRIQQVGPPRELYEKPRNLFVATFIGSPTMNVLEGALRADGTVCRFEGRGVALDLGSRPGLARCVGRRVTLGVRPEALTPGEGEVRARVELAERLGPETLLYVVAGEERLVAKAPSDWEGEPGAEIRLAVHPKGLHVFVDGERQDPAQGSP